jgi:alpha-tubulin suppressor-like RCC1 family protein
VQAVVAGFAHSLALQQDGRVRAWGDNASGQLNLPSNLQHVQQIAAGGYHSLALLADGTVVAWGENSSGQCSVPSSLTEVRAISAGAHYSLALRTNGTVVVWGAGATGIQRPPTTLVDVQALASGFHHTLALRSDGTVMAWGDNRSGQTNVPPDLTDVVAVAAGLDHSVALRADGALVLWGGNADGQLDVRVLSGRIEAVGAGAGFTVVLASGPSLTRQPADAEWSAGGPIEFACEATGRLPLQYQWQLDGTDLPGATEPTLRLMEPTRTSDGRYRVVVSNADGAVQSREAKLWVRPFVATELADQAVFVGSRVTFEAGVAGSNPRTFRWYFGTNAVAIATNETLVLAQATLNSAGDYWVEVTNRLGRATSRKARLQVLYKPSPTIASGSRWVLYDGAVWFQLLGFENARWQFNGQEAPGLAEVTDRFESARPADAGRYRFVVSTPAGEVASPEFDVSVAPAAPVAMAGDRIVLEAGDGHGTVLAYQWFHENDPLPQGTNATLVLDPLRLADAGVYAVRLTDATGDRTVIAARLAVLPFTGGGRVVVWGGNASFFSAANQIENVIAVLGSAPDSAYAILADGRRVRLSDGAVVQDGAGQRVVGGSGGYTLLFRDGHATGLTASTCYLCYDPYASYRYRAVAQGYEHGVGLLHEGTVVVWGRVRPALQPPAGLTGVAAIASGAGHVLALREDGTLVTWGNALAGYAPDYVPEGLMGVRSIAAGLIHNLALKEDGRVVAWGDNLHGQCDVPAGLADVTAIYAGGFRSYAVRADGSLVGWGDVSQGQGSMPAGLRSVTAMHPTGPAEFAVVGGVDRAAIFEQPESVIRELGGTATFRVRAWSGEPIQYQWQKNGVNIPGANAASLELTDLVAADEAEYRVVVSTAADRQTSRPGRLLVNPAPYLQPPDTVRPPGTRGQVVAWGLSVPGGRTNLVGLTNIIALGDSAAFGAMFSSTRWEAQFTERPSFGVLPLGEAGVAVVDVAVTGGFESRSVALLSNGNLRILGDPVPDTVNHRYLHEIAALRGVRQISGNGTFMALGRDGSIYHTASPSDFPVSLPGAVAVAAGWGVLAALLNNGEVVDAYIGGPLPSRVPRPTDLRDVVAISAGGNHLLALRANGRVEAWGGNDTGQCAVPADLTNAIAVAATFYGGFALRADHTVVAWGSAAADLPLPPLPLTNVVAVAGYGTLNYALVAGPLLTQLPQDAAAEMLGSARFEVGATALGPISCQWYREGLPLAGATNMVLTLAGLGPADAGHYEAVLESDGWRVSAGAELTVGPAPVVVEAPQDQAVMEGEAATFPVRVEPAEGAHYQWFFENQAIPGATGSTWRVASATPSDMGRYLVRVSGPLGHVIEVSARLVVASRQQMGRVVSWGPGAAPAPELTGVVDVAAGEFHGLALLADGSVRAWGDNSYGQAVVPPEARDGIAIAAGALHSLVLRRDGSLVGWGDSAQGRLVPPPGRDFVAIAAGGRFSLAVTREGQVVFWGNPYGEVDRIPSEATDVIAVAAGEQHALALRRDGVVIAWGSPQGDATSLPPSLDPSIQQVSAGHLHNAVLHTDGTVTCFGFNSVGQTKTPEGLRGVRDLAVAYGRTLALRQDGTLVGWGQPEYASIPEGLSRVVAVAAGGPMNVAVVETGIMITGSPRNREVMVGAQASLQMQAVGTQPLRFQWYKDGSPIEAATNAVLAWASVRSSDQGTYFAQVSTDLGNARSESATLVVHQQPYWIQAPASTLAWAGRSAQIEAAVGGDAPLNLRWRFAGQVLTGATNPTLMLENVTLDQAGLYTLTATNPLGSIEAESRLSVLVPPPPVWRTLEGEELLLVVGGDAPAGTTWEWLQEGRPIDGADTPTLRIPSLASPVETFTVRVQFGDRVLQSTTTVEVFPRRPQVARGPADQFLPIGAMAKFEIEVTGEQPMTYQWLHNGVVFPQAEQPTLLLSSVDLSAAGSYSVRVANRLGSVVSGPAQLSVYLPPNVVSWGTNQAAVGQVPLDLTNAIAVAAAKHSLALTEDGRVVAWGENTAGEATVPPDLGPVQAVAVGEETSLALLEDGTVRAWGSNLFGQRDVPAGLSNVTAIATSGRHSLALRQDGTVVGWGSQIYHETPTPIGLPPVGAITAPDGASVALLGNGTTTNWGHGFRAPTGLTNVIRLASGPSRVLALRADRRLVGWGVAGGSLTVEGPAQVAAFASGLWISNSASSTWIQSHEIAAATKGIVTTWGANPDGIFTPPTGLSNVTAVAAGRWHNLAVVRAPTIVRQPRGGLFPVGAAVTLEVEIAGNTPHQFQWEFNGRSIDGATNDAFALPALAVEQSGRYRVVVSGPAFSARSADAMVHADSAFPVVLVHPTNISARAGAKVRFAVDAIGRGPLVYNWTRQGQVIAGADGPELVLAQVTDADVGLYEVRVSNAAGTARSEPAALALLPGEAILDDRQAVVVGAWEVASTFGQNGTSYLRAPAGVGQAYVDLRTRLPRSGTWRVSSRFFSVVNGATSTPVVVFSADGAFRVWPPSSPLPGWRSLGEFTFSTETDALVRFLDAVSSPSRLAVADAIRFEYVPHAPRLVSGPAPVVAIEGQEARFQVVADGAPPLTFQWQRGGENLPGETGPTLVLPAASCRDVGDYRVLIANFDGALSSPEAPLTLAVLRPALSWTRQGQEGQLHWDAANAILQTAAEVQGPYQDVLEARSPFPVDLGSDGQRFFRLRP